MLNNYLFEQLTFDIYFVAFFKFRFGLLLLFIYTTFMIMVVEWTFLSKGVLISYVFGSKKIERTGN